MKNRSTLAVLGLAIYLLSSCALFKGDHAEDNILAPAIAMAWPAVMEDLDRGIADGEEDGDLMPTGAAGLRGQRDALTAAIDAKDKAAVAAVPFKAALYPWCERGIQARLDAGEIGPGVQASLTEQLVQFDRALDNLKD
jgi:hypothetical protein